LRRCKAGSTSSARSTQGEKLVIVPILGSLIVIAAVLLFAVIVFRTSKA